jgi:hypothetical protein
MTLVLVMVFNILVALALGFLFDRRTLALSRLEG